MFRYIDSTGHSSKAMISLRWLGLLPGALIGSLILVVLIGSMFLIGDFFDGSLWLFIEYPQILYVEHFFTPFVITGVFCGSFVYLGANIAPKFKKTVAYALS